MRRNGRRRWCELEELDRAVARLGRGAGALRLRLGEALERLALRGGHHALGFSSLAAYALERCERSGRWAFESRTVARRLLGLPQLRAAVASGDVSWSMAELIARHASPADEQALLERARRSTVRQMRQFLKAPDDADDEEAPLRTLTVTVPAEEAWAFEATRLLVEHLEGGKASLDTVLGAMLAEGEITLQGMIAAEQRGERDLEHSAAARAWLAELAHHRSQAEARCETRIPRGAPAPGSAERDAGEAEADVVDFEGETDPVALDRHIRSLARELALRELAIGSAALQLFEADGWRRLGYATATQYARERAGMSYSALKAHVTLARRALREPVLHDALCTGRIGSEAARLVGRVAVAKTVQAWIARAQERTIKHLHEEVKATELIGRLVERGDLEPPDDEAMNMVAAVEAAVLSGQVYRAADEEVQGGSVFAREQAGVDESPMSAHEQEDAVPPRRGAGKTCLRLRVSEETYRQYRALERDYLQHTAHPIGFLGFLCLAVWDSWHAGLGRKVAYGDIYARDRYRCSSPVCTRGDVTPHHLRFRSQGGDDAPENVTSLCVWCHLEGVHGGRIRALPPAPEVRWVLGERAILAVHGRRKQELDRAA